MKWIVMCQVSGGVTGFRQGPLKQGGVVRQYNTFEEADAEARHMMSTIGSNPHRTADYKYWAMRAE